MKTHGLVTEYNPRRPEGFYTVCGQNYMVMDDEFISDIEDMGYREIDIADLIAEYYDWLEDATA